MMKPTFKLTLALVSATTLLHTTALTAEAAAPGGAKLDTILNRYVEALGGKAAIAKITNSISKATANVAGSEIQVEIVRAAPAQQASRVEIPGMGTMREVFDGKQAWSVNPFQGNSEKTGEDLAKTRRDAAFHQPLQMKQLFAPLAYKGTETLDSQKVEVLEAKLAGGALERFYFGADTGLLVRRVSEFDASSGRVTTEVTMEDYQAVDGVKQPYTLRMKVENPNQGPMDLLIKVSELRQNVPLPENVFAQPE